ncbi:MAG: MFS transporter [Candidatus Nanohaloarchaea archaeon]
MSPIADDRRRPALAVLAGGNFAQLGVRLLLGALVPFVDRFGERPLVILGLGGAVVGSILVGLSPTLLVFGVFTLLLGAGTGLYFAPATALISRSYEERGGPIGMLTATGAAAGVVFPAAGSLLGASIGWRPVLWIAGGVTLLFLLAIYRWVPSVPPANPTRSLGRIAELSRHRELLGRPSVAYTTVVAVMVGFAFQAFSSFFPTFLVEYRGTSAGLAGVLFGIAFGLSTLAQPVAGGLSDRVGRDGAIALSVVLFVSGLLVLLGIGSWPGLLVGVTLLGTGVSWPGSVQARFMDQLSDAERGYGFGLARTVYMGLASAGSVVVGTLAEAGGWILGYGAVALLLILCLVVLATNRVMGLDL